MKNTLSQYSAPILRYSMAGVFMWFGVQQLLAPQKWISYLPEFIVGFGIDPHLIVQMNGAFEIIASLLLLVGCAVTWVAGVLSLHLFFISWTIGLTATGVRDLGLAFATLVVALQGKDQLCFPKIKENNKF